MPSYLYVCNYWKSQLQMFCPIRMLVSHKDPAGDLIEDFTKE